jgi:predicted ArsR family transcriptional regulator
VTIEDAPGRHAALASPVRQRVLEMLAGEPAPLTAQQLATTLALHVTTVRFHLEHLEQAGLVVRETRHAGRRGRPSAHYRAVDADPAQAREEMIDALADALAGGAFRAPGTRSAGWSAADESRAAGRRWAEQLPAPAGEPREAIVEAFTRLGFDPEPDGDVVRLRSCPFREAARRHPQVVCQVHRGLVEGIAARTGPGTPVDVELAPFVEPDACLVRLVPPSSPTPWTDPASVPRRRTR